MPASNRSRRTYPPLKKSFRLAPLGDSAITVEFGDEIDPTINARAVAFAQAVVAQRWTGIVDVVPTYRSVTIYYDALQWKSAALANKLKTLPQRVPDDTESQGTLHEIPVLYGGEYGPDLSDVAAFARLSSDQTVTLHASIRYRVYMLGFSPGFPYLGLIPERLAMPRLATPRAKVPAGSVGIADRQTGIYPTTTPGGWRLIGRTPIRLYHKTGESPFLLKPGDVVQFKPIDQAEFDRLSHEVSRDDY